MKRYIAIFLTLCLILGSFTGCKDDAEEYNNQAIDEGIYAIYADLMANLLPEYELTEEEDPELAEEETSGDAETAQASEDSAVSAAASESYIPDESILPAFRKYIHKWAADNDIKASHDDSYNIIMSKAAVDEKKDADSTVLHCELSTQNAVEDLYTAATLMYIIQNADDNAFFRVVITANDDGEHEGALSISKKYLSGDHVISVAAGEKNRLCLASGGVEEYEMTAPLTRKEPTYQIAYEIAITGIKNEENSSAKAPNPIKTLGNLLANCKSSGILFEMASFEGGTDAYTYPEAAKVIVLINENNQNSFIKKFDNSSSKFLSKYQEKYPELTYTLTEVAAPSQVLSFEDSDYIVSLVYTLMNGTYSQDDDEVMASSNLGRLTTENDGNFYASITAKSTSLDTLSEMSDIFEITCHLCNGTYSIVDSKNPWAAASESKVNAALASEYYNRIEKELKTYSTLDSTVCTALSERKSDLDLARVEFNIEKPYQIVETIFELLGGQKYDVSTSDTSDTESSGTEDTETSGTEAGGASDAGEGAVSIIVDNYSAT